MKPCANHQAITYMTKLKLDKEVGGANVLNSGIGPSSIFFVEMKLGMRWLIA